MKIDTTLNIKQSVSSASTDVVPEEQTKEKERYDEFETVLKKFDAMQETPSQRQRRVAKEEKVLQEKRDKQRRANNIQSRIIHLRSKIMLNKEDKAAASELSMAKTQLFWTTNSN